MPENDFLFSKSKRRFFFLSVLTGIVALLSIKFYVIPSILGVPIDDVVSIVNSIINNLIVALFSSLAISALIIYVSEHRTDTSKIEIIEPYELKNQLNKDLRNISEFRYRGHSAKWTIALTIPKLAEAARRSRTTKKIDIEIIDPRDVEVCKKYIELRKRINPTAPPDSWNVDKIQHEVISTIISSYYWSEKEPLLKISVGLTKHISLFRIDFTSNSVIITTPYVREISIRYDKEAYPYKLYKEDLITTFDQSDILPKIEFLTTQKLTVEIIEEFLIGINFKKSFIDMLSLDKIIEMVKYPENPFPI